MIKFAMKTSALAIVAALAFSSATLADKGGQPNAQGVANGQGAAHAHQNGNGDANPDRGNDTAPPAPEPEESTDDTISDYQEYQDATVEEEGEYDEEGAEQ